MSTIQRLGQVKSTDGDSGHGKRRWSYEGGHLFYYTFLAGRTTTGLDSEWVGHLKRLSDAERPLTFFTSAPISSLLIRTQTRRVGNIPLVDSQVRHPIKTIVRVLRRGPSRPPSPTHHCMSLYRVRRSSTFRDVRV